ncbi:hypothetical protein PGT21_022691 [Puccinia graminis f. sp. tritici]|uniref:Uncharacterized protein n=1 Tax=Puccinia graminis f. sp. tritici TaxID=56615 RepID=A0A5B0QFV3_PUCGR|nr:hypothetical protein PGT21_022691 [Puccinia graminis f. sp. tritici]
MVVFRTRKSSISLNDSHDSSGSVPPVKAPVQVISPSPHPLVPSCRVLSPVQAQGLKQYSFSSDVKPTSAYPHLRSSSNASNESHQTQTSQPHPHCCPQSFAPKYTVGHQFSDSLQRANSIQSSPHQPQPQQQQLATRPRLASFMGAQDQSFPSAAPAQSSFRLFKSKILSSTSKLKQSAQFGLGPSSSNGAPYLSPSLAASSDLLNNPSQAAYHEQSASAGQQKFNTVSQVRRPNFNNPSQQEPADWVHLDPSALSLTPRPSTDSARPTSIHAGYSSSPAPMAIQAVHSTSPTNRIVIDSNSSRRNYPQFNNKPAMQAGPRVMRINPQSETLMRFNTPPSGNLPNNELSIHAQSLRAIPVPHGGGNALLSINASHPLRQAAPNLPPQHTDPPPFAPAPAAKLPAPPEPVPTSLAIEQAKTPPSTYREPPTFNRLGSNEPHLINTPQRLSSIQLEQPVKAASSSRVGAPETALSNIAVTTPSPPTPSAESNVLSASSIDRNGQMPEPDHAGYHHSTLKSSLAYRKPPTPPVDSASNLTAAPSSTVVTEITKPIIENQVAGPSSNMLSSPPAGSLDLGDFSYLFTNSNSAPTRTDTSDSKHQDSPLSKRRESIRPIPPPLAFAPLTGSSNLVFPPSQSPMTPTETLSVTDSRPSSTSQLSGRSDNFSSLPFLGNDQSSPRLSSTRSNQSPSPLPSTPIKSDKHASSTPSLHIAHSPSTRSPLPSSSSTASPTLLTFKSSLSTAELRSTSENFTSPLPSPLQKPILPTSKPQTPEPQPVNSQSQFELEQARQMILGLQNQVKQLKDASLRPSPVIEENISDSSSTVAPLAAVTAGSNDDSQKSLLSVSIPSEPRSYSTENPSMQENQQQSDDSLETTPLHAKAQPASPFIDAALGRNPESESPAQYAFPSQEVARTTSQFNDADQQTERSLPQSVPSRLPLAQHRIRGMASTDFGKTFDPDVKPAASIPRRQIKLSLASAVSTEYRYDTPESCSTQMTTPSSISTSHRGQHGSSGKQPSLSERMRSNPGTNSHGHGWPRERQNSIHNPHPEQPSRLAGPGGQQEPRWLPSRPLNESVTSATVPRSLSSLSQSRVRPDPATSRIHRHHQPSPSISLQSIQDDEEFSESDSELESVFERTSHVSSHQASRSGLDSLNEDSVLNLAGGKLNRLNLRLMTKPELLAIIKKQHAKLENTRLAFAAERDDLIDTLEQTREREAELSRERERLLAEDAWKTEELNRAREEIGWLSRLADTLELEKSRLENRANSMANELKRAVVDLRTVSTASSQGLGSSRDLRTQPVASYQSQSSLRSPVADTFTSRKSDSGSQGRSVRNSSHFHNSHSSTPHRVRQESVESDSTVCRLGPSPKLQVSRSQANLKNPSSSWRGHDPQASESPVISPRTRELNQPQRKSPAQRSMPDFRSPLSPLKIHSQRPARHEKLSSRQVNSRRRPSDAQSISSARSHTEEHDEEIESEDGFREDVIMEEEQEERGSRVDSWGQHELDRRHSRTNSESSQAISPSSTVFADHHRDHSSRTTTRSSSSQDRQDYGYRSSLVSLQLRPEDELFLENYLEEDADGLDSDLDY